MTARFEFNSLLVPIDFSPASQAALERALLLASGEGPVVILQHVVDTALVEFAVQHGWGAREDVVGEMRRRAEEELAELQKSASEAVEIDVIVSEGVPFLEILQKADDFAVDAIVIGKIGARGALEKLLFGTTAEKVLRGSRRPVVVLPITP
ncbi:MAG: universal stress protein [Pirellulaceae bacterium]